MPGLRCEAADALIPRPASSDAEQFVPAVDSLLGERDLLRATSSAFATTAEETPQHGVDSAATTQAEDAGIQPESKLVLKEISTKAN